ncbi:MAG: Ig-like domain-containing protein [Pseudomonadota bacterium]
MIVGAEGDEANGERSGAAYVYDLANLEPQGAASVASITPTFFPRGDRFGAEVTVIVQDTRGTPVANAAVTARAFGGLVQNLRGTTDASGTVVLRSLRASPAPFTYTVCVFNVVGDLPYDPQSNLETCDSASSP